jgi:hypothetical protein
MAAADRATRFGLRAVDGQHAHGFVLLDAQVLTHEM